jgi:broad specificity phosphatase PhoE
MRGTQLWIVRHPQAGKNVEKGIVGGRSRNSPPTEPGIEQAEQLGSYLGRHEVPLTAAYSGPSFRTVAQATLALTRMGRPDLLARTKIEDDLDEFGPGVIEGKARPDDYGRLHEWPWDFVPSLGGESAEMVGARGIDLLTQAGEANPGGTVIVFGHGGWIKCVAAELERRRTGVNPVVAEATARAWLRQHVGHCSISRFDYHPEAGVETVYVGHPTIENPDTPPPAVPSPFAHLENPTV